MSLPTYHQIQLKSASLEDLEQLLNLEMNLKHPVVFNLKNLDLDQQRDVIGLIENFFTTQKRSYKYPYPVYLISDHEKSITLVPLLKDSKELPKLFENRESKMNVKESHLASRNKLLQ